MSMNPVKRLVGRLFLWFWLTTLITAASAFWLSRVWNDSVEVSTPSQKQADALLSVTQALASAEAQSTSLKKALMRAERRIPFQVIAVDSSGELVLKHSRRTMRPAFLHRLLNVQSQSSPIVLRQRGRMFVGPVTVTYENNQYALFLTDREPPPAPFEVLGWLIGTGIIISMLLSYWFARSLVKPIQHIQQASQKLAAGDWESRTDEKMHRQDELGDLARNFNKMADQLQAMWQSQERLLADISHELRSPLTRLQMAVGLAVQKLGQQAHLQRIEKEAEQMETLIGHLLTINRATFTTEAFAYYRLCDLVYPITEDGEFEARQLEKVLTVEAIPDKTVWVNKPLFTAALENVLRNAIRYANAQIKVSVVSDATSYSIQVDDDGPGLGDSDLEAIFKPFYRAESARDRASGGVGLGLAIAKAAMSTHHGQIYAKPSDLGGLQITLNFSAKPKNETDKTNR